jgi:hypothetical protein
MCSFCLSFVYICIAIGDPVVKRGGCGWFQLTFLTSLHFCDYQSIKVRSECIYNTGLLGLVYGIKRHFQQ